MKQIHRFLYVGFFIVFPFFLQGQDSDLPEIIPPTPTASGLGEYGNIPISLYTGTPNISIPIYQMKGRDISIPISLSYHASGIKVDQMASWVGLGWSLNGTGVITRTIKGLPDEDAFGFRGYHNIGQKVGEYLDGTMTSTEEGDFKQKVADGIWDSEPDIYHFNFMGHSGKLIYDADGSFAIIPYQKLKVEGHGAATVGFTITTPDGTQYIFQEEEESATTSECGHGIAVTATTGWYLSQIISTHGEEVVFTYAEELIEYEMNIGEIKSHFSPYAVANNTCPSPFNNNTTCTNLYSATAKRLESIENDHAKVEFTVPSTDRDDLANSYQLDKIKVYSPKTNLIPNHVFRLEYSYFTSLNERLKLDRITEYSGDETEHKDPHKFFYHTSVPDGIPSRLSYAQDHWGFFNANTSTTFVPALTFNITDPLPDPYIIFPYTSLSPVQAQPVIYSGADREPDPARMLACALNKITYPTGGYTLFEFESHTYGREFIEDDLIDVNIQEMTSSYDQAEVTTNGTDVVPFTIDQWQFIHIEITNPNPNSGEFDQHVAIIDAGETDITNADLYIEPWELSSTLNTTLALSPGDYELVAHSGLANHGSFISIEYESFYRVNGVPVVSQNALAGGLRIKKMTHHDGLTSLNDQVSRYEYTLLEEGGRSRSSGILLNKPRYVYHPSLSDLTAGVISYCFYLNRKSTSYTMLGTTQGSHIGYQEVVVHQGDVGVNGNGRSVHLFVSPDEVPDEGTAYVFPFPPSTSYDHKRGKPLKIIHFSETNANDTVSKSQYEYTVEPTHNKKVVRALTAGYIFKYHIPSPASSYFGIGAYNYVSEWEYPSREIQRTYNPTNPTDFVETITDFSYGNPDHAQLTEKSSTQPDGNIYSEAYYYPEDFPATSGSHPITELRDNFMHAYPVEVLQKLNNTVLSGSRTEYAKEHGNLIPRRVHKIETSTPFSYSPPSNGSGTGGNYQPVVEFTDYDLDGRLLQANKTDDQPTSYLYSNVGSLPVAKVLNASAGEIAYSSFEEDNANTDGNWNFFGGGAWESGGKTGLQAFRLTSNSARVEKGISQSGNYLLSLWYQGNPKIIAAGATTVLPTSTEWTYWEGSFTLNSGSTIKVKRNSGSPLIDEFRLHPADAQMSTICYDDKLRVLNMTDVNSRSSTYIYDALGRLQYVRDHKGNYVQQIDYHYKNH